MTSKCKCGGDGLTRHDPQGYYIQCDRCGRRTLYHETTYDARNTWKRYNHQRRKEK